MKIDYIFPRRIFSSKNSARAKFLTECKMDLKFTAPINIKFIKCLRTNVFSVDFWRRRNQALSYLFFTKTWLQALMLQIKRNGVSLFLRNFLPAEMKKKGEINATKQSWEIGILYTLVRKTKFDHILQKKKRPIPKNCC